MTLAKVKEQDGMTLAKVKEQDGITLANKTRPSEQRPTLKCQVLHQRLNALRASCTFRLPELMFRGIARASLSFEGFAHARALLVLTLELALPIWNVESSKQDASTQIICTRVSVLIW